MDWKFYTITALALGAAVVTLGTLLVAAFY